MTAGLPPSAPAEGAAFPLAVRWLATLMVGAMLGWGLRAAGELSAAAWSAGSAVVFALAILLVLWCLVWIWRSRVRADAWGVRQSWMWRKQVPWSEMAQARLVGVPRLEWIIAPRLVVRVRGGGLVVFHACDRRVLQALALFVSTGVPPEDQTPKYQRTE